MKKIVAHFMVEGFPEELNMANVEFMIAHPIMKFEELERFCKTYNLPLFAYENDECVIRWTVWNGMKLYVGWKKDDKRSKKE
jgi:hypothetical protein